MAGDPGVGRILERLYERFHRPEFVHPDPIEFVRAAEPADRETCGLIASALALGRVEAILEAVGGVLAALGRPDAAARSMTRRELRRLFRGFRYRFFSDRQLAAFLFAVGECLRLHGSLQACFRSFLLPGEESVRPAMKRFVAELRSLAAEDIGILLSDPAKGSACKRLHLYLRWMVRRDAIDPGGWDVAPSMLLVPVDVHMLRVSRMLGFTRRRQPDLAASVEITRCLALYCPEDPVRYDFSMTRLGIHPALTYDDLRERT